MTIRQIRQLRPHKDFTHHLSIRLMSDPSFLPQFKTSLQRFRNDALGKIPERAFFPPESARLYFGRLNLETRTSFAGFSKFLHGLDYRKLLGEAAQSSSIAADRGNTVNHVTPLKVDISGLATKQADLSNVVDLHLVPIDPTSRLHHFWTSLIHSFSAAGFPIIRPQEPTVQFAHSVMVHWDKSKATRKTHNLAVPRFDARELIEKYEHSIWAKDVHLQRLSVLGVGISEWLPNGGGRVFKQPPEIDSVVLP